MEEFDWMDMMEKMQEIRHFCSLHIRGKRQGASSPQELDLLSRMVFSQKPLTPMELSGQTGLSKSAVSRLIESLEKKEFLSKQWSEKDKRSYTLQITPAGNQELMRAYRHYLEPIYRLRRTLGEARFLSLLAQIKEANHLLQSKEGEK